MVHTRRSFEAISVSPISGLNVAAKVKKRVKIQEEVSSDEDETVPFSSTRRLHYDNKAIASASKSKPNGLCGTHALRSTKVVIRDIACFEGKPVTKTSCTKTADDARSQRRRHSVDHDEQEFMNEPSGSIRRSSRQRRGVYETLNVNLLTDHRYLHTFDSSLIPDDGKFKKKSKQCRGLVDERFFENNDLSINMYDNVKRRHDTPSPEKQSQGSSVEEDDGDDEGDEDNDENDTDNSEGVEEIGEHQENKYLLRKRKPVVNRYMAPPMRKTGEKKNYLSVRRKMYPPLHTCTSPVRQIQHKRKAINMSSSTSSSEDSSIEKDEQMFEHRKKKSTAKARLRALPINLTIKDISKGILRDRERIGSSLADVDPMSIDKMVHFDSVGGLGKQIRGLKEMILFPLIYPEVFSKFKINPPRGVLFYGPPGTGKTLVARALANECSLGNQKVAFFMRKGADCLSKWVGESERQLRLLFDQAYCMRPSIIFFDEIDGLAPVRSSRQDQIHSSIVSTLLALMDGLDSRGEVVVIGATNRIDAIDPALRRPGRFDREFQFPLPDKEARRVILSILTREWEPRLSQAFINMLADHCVGYCGADIKALCTEAALFALRRCYPQVYVSSRKLLLDVNSIEVTFKDFLKATKSIVPACQRSVVSPARALSEIVKPLLCNTFLKALNLLAKVFPHANSKTVLESSSNQATITTSKSDHRLKAIGNSFDDDDDDDLSSDDEADFPSIYDHSNVYSASNLSRSERYTRRMKQRFEPCSGAAQSSQTIFNFSDELFKSPVTFRPRLLLAGQEGAGQTSHLAPAILHSIEHLSVHSLDLPALYGVAARTPEEACSQLFREARRTSPSVIYMPHIHSLWYATTDSLHATLLSLLQDLPPLCPVLLLATTENYFEFLPAELKKLFPTQTDQVLHAGLPSSEERKAFFEKLFLVFSLQTTKVKKNKKRSLEVLPFAPAPPSRQLSESELKKIQMNEENTLLELRIFLRDVHHKLISDRRFKEFSKAVNLEEVPDYLDVITKPMDLSTIMQKIDCHQYNTCGQYLTDFDLIASNALKYNPNVDPLGKIIRHRACELKDTAHSLIKSQLEPEFEKACEEIIKARQQRGETSRCNPIIVLPRLPESASKHPHSLVSEPAASPLITAYNQTTSTLASSSTTIDSGSQRSSESRGKRKRRNSYWFGQRKRANKKKNLAGEPDKVIVEDKKCDEKQSGDQNSGTTSNGKKSHCDDKSSSMSSPNLQNGKSNTNGGSSVSSNEPQNGSSISNHDPHNGSSSISSLSSYKPQNGSNGTNGEGINNIHTDVSSNGSSSANRKDSLKSDTLSTVTQCDTRSNEGLGAEVAPKVDLTNEDSICGGEALTEQSVKTVPNVLTVADVTNLSNIQLSKARQSVTPRGQHNEDGDESQGDATRMCNTETLAKFRKELEALLNQIVDMTEGYNVEMLERCHNRLQLLANQYRYIADKTELIKDFSDLMAQWKDGLAT